MSPYRKLTITQKNKTEGRVVLKDVRTREPWSDYGPRRLAGILKAAAKNVFENTKQKSSTCYHVYRGWKRD